MVAMSWWEGVQGGPRAPSHLRDTCLHARAWISPTAPARNPFFRPAGPPRGSFMEEREGTLWCTVASVELRRHSRPLANVHPHWMWRVAFRPEGLRNPAGDQVHTAWLMPALAAGQAP